MNTFPHYSEQHQQQHNQQHHLIDNIIHNHGNTHVSVMNTTNPKITPLKRTRAKRSCDFCRKRKSRCDADACTPCTNCKAWGYTCEFQTIRKKRGPPSVYVDNLERKCKKMESLLTALTNCSIQYLELNDFQYNEHSQSNSTPIQTDSSSDEDEETDNDTQKEQEFDKDYDSIKYTGQSSTGFRLFDRAFKGQSSILWPGRDDVKLKLISPDELMIAQTENNGKPDTLLSVGLSMRFPLPTIHSNFSLLKNTTMKPTKNQLDAMIEMYFSHIHILFPIINKAKVLNEYKQESSNTHSILIQAILAVMFRFTSQNLPELVKDANEFGHVYFKKVMKQLQDSKRSRLSYVQATILIVIYLDMDKDDSESLQWITLGNAIRMAQDLGLHRSCSKWDLPVSEIETRHRVFYACYIMDRWLGARSGKPLTILDRDFDTDMPSLFEATDDDNDTNEKKIPIYQFFVLLIELSEILGRVLKSLYAPNAKNANLDAALDNSTILSVLQSRLKVWKTSLNKYTEDAYLTELDHFNLKIYYFTVVLLLHRPFCNLPTEDQSHSLALESEEICTNVAKEISRIVTRRQNETKNPAYYAIFFSPTYFIYSLFQSSLVFLSNALKTRCSVNIQMLYQSIRLIKNYNEIGPASRAIDIINMLASINGLCPGTNNSSNKQQTKRSPHKDTKTKQDIETPPLFHHTITENPDMLQSNKKLPNSQDPLFQSYPQQQQNMTQQPNCYAQTYPVYTHGYSHQRSISLDQLNGSHQTFTQQHSRSISHDQLEMMTSMSSFARNLSTNQKPNASSMHVNNSTNTTYYTPQLNNQQLMSSFHTTLPTQPYTSTPYDPNMNISNTVLPPSNINWPDWDLYVAQQNSSHHQQ